ncbi:MAG TPA: NAD-glutamate dehydrogenase [Acidimicrobiia bacterium]|nr:NAD-glutamate dehydrogenase [Acidimicrobiia bacterium]
MDDGADVLALAERLAPGRRPGAVFVRVTTPPALPEPASTHTMVDVVADEMPFVGDSLTAHLARRAIEVHDIAEHHGDGIVVARAEIDRETDPHVLAHLQVELEDVLEDVRISVGDWAPMRDLARELSAQLLATPPIGIPTEEVLEAAAFLQWLVDDHFTFVAACTYRITGDGDAARLELLGEGAFGTARRRAPRDPGARGTALQARYVLTLTKAADRSTVHRAVPLDDVRVRQFDASGRAVGEVRFIGLYTSTVYTDSIERIPVLRRKLEGVEALAGAVPGEHAERMLTNVLETLPRELLFRLPIDALHALAQGVAGVGERRGLRLFVNPDEFRRFVSCLVYLPRDRYTTRVRTGIVDALLQAFDATSVDFSVLIGDSMTARLHLVLDLPMTTDGAPTSTSPDPAAVEAGLVGLLRVWTDELRDALQAVRGEEEGLDAFRAWGSAFPPAYQDDVPAAEAVADIAVLESLDPAGDLAIRLVRGAADQPNDPGDGRLVLYRSGHPLVLSDVMPVLDQLDVIVVDERPYEIRPAADAHGPHDPRWIYSFGVHAVSGASVDEPALQARVAELFLCVWSGAIENDALNRLVVAAGLEPSDVVILRALAKYLHQVGVRFTEATLASTLVANPAPTRGVVALFHARLDPAAHGADADADAISAQLDRDIDAVTSLDDDRILRSFAALARAAVRTTAFFDDHVLDDRLAIKFDPALLEFLPRPRPAHEIWVYSPRVEGVHLRGGDIARGGIRWSDRRDDFRTEILGLMKAQTAKNSVIVPVGAKGGFVVKRPPIGDPEALRAEVLECYRTFIRGLLDLTDNLIDGRAVPLAAAIGAGDAGTVRLDGDDPYLVVAADKGTASFSDVANELAAEYHYWLDDAFASGGSRGYDHKEMGITARGAWVSVQSHFRALGVDADTAELTAVGIGDMSGDVFGNGMLRSPHLKLVAAFDHRHVFVDPTPDPARSFEERQRLFALPRSSWADYDASLISAGGGVFARDAKSITVSPEARAALGIDSDAPTLTPDDLVVAVLRAPVDLFWNGGIGTFVKATTESNVAVGDRANDAVRIDASALRARVVAEGGNLGFTQAARIEFALGGGRIYTDAIDNSAGVDCSDHEVNIKILLGAAIRGGALDAADRDPLLDEMTDEVAALVLADNVAQANALEIAAVEAVDLLGVHGRQMERLEQAGLLDRALEGLPDVKGLQERAAMGRGLTAPELAVLLAFTKINLQHQLVASDVPDDPALERDLLAYFPAPLRDRFADIARAHPLRREIVATVVANAVVNRAGISFLSRLADELGVALPMLTRAHVIARDVYDVSSAWAAIDELDFQVTVATQNRMFLALRRLVERAARWFVRHDDALPIGPTIEAFHTPVAAVLAGLREHLDPAALTALDDATEALVADGVPRALAQLVASTDSALGALTIADIARVTGAPIERVARVHFALAARLELDLLRDRIAALPRGDRWQTEARAALRDDLADCHRALTESVIATGDGTGAAEIDAWLAARPAEVARYEHVVEEITTSGVFGLAQLTAARRALRELSPDVEPDRRST